MNSRFKRIYQYFKPNRKKIIFALIASAFVSATDGATAYIVKHVLDDIFIAKKEDMLRLIPIIIVVMYSFRCGARFIQVHQMQYAAQMAVKKLREELYAKMIYLPMRYYDTNETGTMMARIISDANNMQNAIPSAVKIFRDSLSVFFLIGVVLYQDFKLGSTIFIALPIMLFLIKKSGKMIKRYSRKEQEQVGVVSSALQESFTGVKVVKAFASEDREINKFIRLNNQEVHYKLKKLAVTAFSSPMMETIAGFAVAGIIFYGGFEVIKGNTTPGTFFSFVTAFGLMFEPFKKIIGDNTTVQTAFASADRIFELLDEQNEMLDNDGTLECNAEGKEIRFDNVFFKYQTGEDIVLNGMNLTVEPGMTVALVGASGAGKSTIAALIPRFYDVTGGHITIGGTDIREFSLNSLRRNIGIVSQEPFLFNETVKNNIAYGVEEADMDKIRSAADSAYATGFINELTDGFDTVIGERGDRLSGGQKQRLTIARALLMNPPILILDEATSALDTESERIVQQALTNLMKGRTSFVIAHRLSTIVNADMIVVLDNGRVMATGKHNELLKSSDIYSNLCRLQFGSVGD
ncbi:ABC transporter transmembrane domain-containing protein [Seleniivibrio sp.]|uniref:ABC transporter ATP-binding protein n=1 Tax=Seleniivibrio sp. TaxID=2898801 RepID=UPI0025DB9185|nr:ABC transporter transmembrane domain-containing protein [Seleniivibrio sp.]MCD8553177.1 ABC transporter ATP-binding protein/permease [Seleniivibrio sp.]